MKLLAVFTSNYFVLMIFRAGDDGCTKLAPSPIFCPNARSCACISQNQNFS
jgi:hypothetical protein